MAECSKNKKGRPLINFGQPFLKLDIMVFRYELFVVFNENLGS